MKITTVYFKVSNMDQGVPRPSPWWSEFRCETINLGLLQMEEFKSKDDANFVPVFEVSDEELKNTKELALQAGAKVAVDILHHPDQNSYVLADPFGNEFEVTRFHG